MLNTPISSNFLMYQIGSSLERLIDNSFITLNVDDEGMVTKFSINHSAMNTWDQFDDDLKALFIAVSDCIVEDFKGSVTFMNENSSVTVPAHTDYFVPDTGASRTYFFSNVKPRRSFSQIFSNILENFRNAFAPLPSAF